jgi:N-acetylglucosamine kinase-like BadF-type ATPase
MGAPGLADADGLRLARAAIEAATLTLPADVMVAVDCVGIGAAGVDANRHNARDLAVQISQTLTVPVAIVTDALIAHAGALNGSPGTILVAGTGSVAFGIDIHGDVKRADGWGIWLGDDGSGRWIGQEGIKSALRHYDGRGPATTLSNALIDAAGPLDGLPAYVSGSVAPERVLATFAPLVLDHAAAGDAVASAIVVEAVRLLTKTAVASAAPRLDISILGGLTHNPLLARLLRRSLVDAGLNVVPPIADALAGAALIARQTELPHERYAIRVSQHQR